MTVDNSLAHHPLGSANRESRNWRPASPSPKRCASRTTTPTTRPGRDTIRDFLNDPSQKLAKLGVPMPKAASKKAPARTRDGGDSAALPEFLDDHARRAAAGALHRLQRRPRRPKLKKPEPGRDYTRRGLSGLGANDQERWFIDPRLDEKLQLPDIFFTNDRKAFDKGHIVRRDDVAWGRSYDELKCANGDSYHVTNCSPQVGEVQPVARRQGQLGRPREPRAFGGGE